jgi:excisionase family DNA binding protein
LSVKLLPVLAGGVEMKTMVDGALFASRKDGANFLGLSVRTIDYAIERGLLRVRRIGRRVLIPKAELERFAAKDHARIAPASKAREKAADNGGIAVSDTARETISSRT